MFTFDQDFFLLIDRKHFQRTFFGKHKLNSTSKFNKINFINDKAKIMFLDVNTVIKDMERETL